MKKLIVALLISIFLSSCYFNDRINEIPISDFGVQGATHYIDKEIFLFYSSTDETDEKLYFEWKLLSVPPDSDLKNQEYPFSQRKENNPRMNSFIPDVPGNYQVSLLVTDEYGAKKSSGAKNITVQNRAPIPSLSVSDNDYLTVNTPIYFDGSASFDPDKEYLEYFWSISIPECSKLALNILYTNSLIGSENISSSKTFFTPDCEGWYQISLKVSDRNTTSEVSSLINIEKNRAPQVIETEPDYHRGVIPISSTENMVLSVTVYDENSDYNELNFEWSMILNGTNINSDEFSPEYRLDASIYSIGDFLELHLKIKDKFDSETEVIWYFVVV
ncbi:hypothetical protein JXR93_04530 [bacterium]|nr:hypothetical protein [bacterium]